MQRLRDENLNAPFDVSASDLRIGQLCDGLVSELTGQDNDKEGQSPSHGGSKVLQVSRSGSAYSIRVGPILGRIDGAWTTITIIKFVNRILHSSFKPSFLVIGAGPWRFGIVNDERQKTQEQCDQESKR